jgi:diacylglycerol kinase (ATP)
VKRLYTATINSLRGLGCGLRSDAAVREEVALLAFGSLLGIFLAPNLGWYVAMVGVLLVLLAVELLNTAVEKLADHVSREWHPQLGMAKDLGSAAVFCTLCLTGLVWLAAVAQRIGLLR